MAAPVNVDLGWTVWSVSRGTEGVDELTGAQIDPLGGVVVEVRTTIDEGEIVVDAYVTLSPIVSRGHLVFKTIKADDVVEDPPPCPPEHAVLNRLIRAMGTNLGCKVPSGHADTVHVPKRGDIDAHERDLVAYMLRLTAVLGAATPPTSPPRRHREREAPPPAPGGVFVD